MQLNTFKKAYLQQSIVYFKLPDIMGIMKNFRGACFFICMSVFLLFSCGKDSDEPSPPQLATTDLRLYPGETFQSISGFGAANQMWGTQFPSSADIRKAFGTGNDELGLSLFRIRLASASNEWSRIVDVSREVSGYADVKILASPWSPPASLKSNNSDTGGYLPEENYDEYAAHINSFLSYMQSNNVDIYAVSIQNEPDIQVSYESSDWTPAQMRDFLKNYGGQITGAKIAAAESFNFTRSFTDVLLNEPEAEKHIDIIAGHIYGGGAGPYPLAEQKNKEIWMTEYLLNQNATSSWSQLSGEVIWDESLKMLETVHNAMADNWNAYIWWYLKRYYSFLGDGTQGTTAGEILKRGYAFSHYSKFVRPGYERIEAEINSGPNIKVTAYKGGNQIVIVLVNTGNIPKAGISIELPGAIPNAAAVYTTSLQLNRRETEVTNNADNKILIDLLPKSIVTVVLDQ